MEPGRLRSDLSVRSMVRVSGLSSDSGCCKMGCHSSDSRCPNYITREAENLVDSTNGPKMTQEPHAKERWSKEAEEGPGWQEVCQQFVSVP